MRPAEKKLFDRLTVLAKKGARCPPNDELGPRAGGMLMRLRRFGLIRIELYSCNWRVIEIDGCRTQECPQPDTLYLVLDQHGRHERGGSSPRVASAEQDDRDREFVPALLPGDAADRLRAALGNGSHLRR